ncbi:outer dynein arm-docking complex subunit 4 [Lampetra fluviatilis]
MNSDEEETPEGPKSSFATYLAEGDKLFQKGDYTRAIESYSTALDIQPNDRNCLVARSKCYLKMGDAQYALRDAEASLKDDNLFFKGLLWKAEALYAMGDFEFALVFYHRGNRMRPELEEFRLGIQKAQEAIDNSVGSPSSVKLENKGDLSFFFKPEEGKKGKGPARAGKTQQQKQASERENRSQSSKTQRQLLGELYNDRQYLQRLMQDQNLIKGSVGGGMRVEELIREGLEYLDTRTDFWRQQKPIYARVRDRKLMRQKWNRGRNGLSPSDSMRSVLVSLEETDQMLADGNAEGSLRKAQQTLKVVEGWSSKEAASKMQVLGNLHSSMGNAQLELGLMEAALSSHQKDLKIAKEHNLVESKSRALDNIGRVHARFGNFKEAVKAWEEKIPLVQTELERAWLFHEIGRCHLELSHFREARGHGHTALTAARASDDDEWQLNAFVLVAQAQMKLRDYKSAVKYFEDALDKATLVKDAAAERAIAVALEEAKSLLNKQPKESSSEETKKQSIIDEEEEEEEKRDAEDMEKETGEITRGKGNAFLGGKKGSDRGSSENDDKNTDEERDKKKGTRSGDSDADELQKPKSAKAKQEGRDGGRHDDYHAKGHNKEKGGAGVGSSSEDETVKESGRS